MSTMSTQKQIVPHQETDSSSSLPPPEITEPTYKKPENRQKEERSWKLHVFIAADHI